jgi:non-heme chloroperoxidase
VRHRVITNNGRAFDTPDRPTIGYDNDTFAQDLNASMATLDPREATLARFSIATGDVTATWARTVRVAYARRRGSSR